ncbi:MAG: ECF transporter S component, partial [Synergistales bacterium]|nr:ECF transporter S component [Synergistales bacterium]
GSGADFFVAYMNAVGQNLLKSVAITVIGSNLVDKVVSCVIAWALVSRLPNRIRSLFPSVDEAV